jgi:hypothetical protein
MAKGRKYDERLHIDMPFEEALERYVGADPTEMRDNIKKSKKKRPPGGRKHKPSDDQGESQNVVRLRDRRKRNHG